MKKLRKLLALLLCVGLCMSLAPGAGAEETSRPYKTAILNVNWSNIESVGHQSSGVACACYALAYCRTLLDNKIHYWGEYDANGGTNQGTAYCSWGNGSYAGYFPTDKDEAFDSIYKEICGGDPVVVKVTGTRTTHHYVTVIGVENVPKSGSISASNLLIIDPCASQFVIENMSNVGYDLKIEEGNYQIEYDNTSASLSFSEKTPFVFSYLDKCNTYPTNLTVKTIKSTYLKSLPCTYNTDHNSTNVVSSALPTGINFIVTELYRNDYDHYDTCWYKVSYNGKEGYIYSGDTSIISYNSNTVSTSGGNPVPTTIPKDRGYWAEWLLSSNYLNIDTVQGYIKYRGGDVLPGYPSEKTGINSKTYQMGSNGREEPVDAGLLFSTLSPGDYTCSIEVKCLYYYGDNNGNLQTKHVWKTAISFNFTKEGDTIPANPTGILPEEIGLTQHTSYTCTLASAAMMLRARMYRSNNSNWTAVTEESIKPVAWCDDGLYHNFTYKIDGNSMTVGYANCSGMSISGLKTLLDNHPEGIVLYERSIPHAVFVCDYQGDTFYCFDPANSSYSGRRTLGSSYLGTRIGNQASILSSVDSYWYVTSYTISPSVSPEMTTGAGRTIPDGNYIIASAADDRYYLDIDGAAYPAADDTNVILWGPRNENPSVCDTWSVKYIDEGGFYTICQNGTDISLDVDGGSIDSGANVKVWHYHDSSAQKWSISKNANGSYRIQAKCSGFSLDNAGGNIIAGNNIRQWTSNDGAGQEWVFVPYVETKSGTWGNLDWTLDENGRLTVRGINSQGNPMNDFTMNSTEAWREYKDQIVNIQCIRVSSIGAYAFSDFNKLNSIIMPKGLISIGSSAFYGCKALNTCVIPDGVADVGQGTFYGCSNLVQIVIPKSITSIANATFAKCEQLTDVYYGGTQDQWEAMKIGSLNNPLHNATIHFAEYTATYNANGGTGAPDPQIKTQGTSLTLSGTKPTRADTNAGSYTVTLNANGGSVSPASLSAARTTSYTFKNWNTTADGSGTSYNAGATYSADADVTLYAQWNSSTKTAAVKLPTPTQSGYIFKGWGTSSSAASGVTGSYTPTKNVTLYAVWEKDSSTEKAQISIEGVNAYPGAVISVPIRLENNPGIIAFEFEPSYDSTLLEWIGVEPGEYGNGIGEYELTVGQPIAWFSADERTDVKQNGIFVTLTFRVNENAKDCETVITMKVDEENVFNANLKNIAFTIKHGTVTIKSHIPGDVNGDGKTNNKDYMALRRYIKYKDNEVITSALDINGDGNVNNKDYMALRRYIKYGDIVIQ